MNKLKAVKNISILFVIGVLFLLTGSLYSQKKYDIKLLVNEKVLFKNCVEDESKLYVPLEELALKIDGSVSIESPYKLGPYFKFNKSKVSLIKAGSGKDAELNVKNTGVLSSEVKIIILDGKQHAYIPFEEFVSAVGGTWKYDESTGIYGVTVGGCGACLIDEQ
ncbi:MAG: hypothetical protein EHM58_17310 [Ignavibacteriae bacterium]|nr:MAG: hypothetical protein EHM58_17310 [Ignavibacteriota bacterium]